MEGSRAWAWLKNHIFNALSYVENYNNHSMLLQIIQDSQYLFVLL